MFAVAERNSGRDENQQPLSFDLTSGNTAK